MRVSGLDVLMDMATRVAALGIVLFLFGLPAVLSGSAFLREWSAWRQKGSLTPGPMISRLFAFLVFSPLTLFGVYAIFQP